MKYIYLIMKNAYWYSYKNSNFVDDDSVRLNLTRFALPLLNYIERLR
jgi:hypothetical protein